MVRRKPDHQGHVHLARKALSELIAAPWNPRSIAPRALAGLGESIRRFGLVQPIIWNRATGHVVGGHQRLKALSEQGVVETDVVVVDLPEMEEKALNVALNSSAIAGEWTPDALPLLDEIAAQMPDLATALLLSDLRIAIRDLLPGARDQLEEDEVPPLPDHPSTKPGDLYRLGRHRLLCGDATKPEDVRRLLENAAPFLMVTDPPYGVDYDPAWRNREGLASTERVGRVANDDRADWRAAYALFPGDVAYVWHAGRFGGEVADGLASCDLAVRAQIVWRKQHFAISRGHYHWAHEPCWYAVRKGRSAKWRGDRTQSTVWDVPNACAFGGATDDATTRHGTQKPVECMGRPMRNHGGSGDIVYDPFLGSGTSIVAAEHLDRVAYALDVDPAYCDVAVARYENLSGKKAVRETR